MNNPARAVSAVVFAYQEVGYHCLQILIRRGIRIPLVVSHRDDPSENIWFHSVEKLAQENNLETVFPESAKDPGLLKKISGISPNLVFSFYYRHLIPKSILDLPRLGAYNMHGSLLPKYRGRCPVNWVLIHGETVTGMTLHEMVEKADAGRIIGQERVGIDFEDTAKTLYDKLTVAAGRLLDRTMPAILDGTATRISQDESQATKFGGRRPEDGLIDFSRNAGTVYNLIRAVTAPYPGAFGWIDGRKWMVWWANPESGTARGGPPGTVIEADTPRGRRIVCGEGILNVLKCGWEHEPPLPIHEFVSKYPTALTLGRRVTGRETLA